MSNPYYTHGSFPSTGAAATSASMRAELDLISAAFDKLPTLTSNANKFVVVNSTATGLTTTSTLPIASVNDSEFTFQDTADNTRKFQFAADAITPGATRLFTMPDADTTLVGTGTTQTLTNKTLTAPVIATIVNTGTLTLPTSTDTLVGRATTDTLTNKTLTNPTIGTILNTGTLTLPTSTDTLVGRATTDTLTNKTISGANNSLTNIGNSSLTNSAVTIGSSSLSLGGTLTTLAGVTISGASNTLSNIANASLTNSGVTFNGVTVALGASGTIAASTTNALTIGTGLQLDTGTTFNGGAARTLSIDSTVATLSGSQTLSNKTISGSSNTLSNIANASLTNSSITIGSSSISLGSTASTISGLTSLSATGLIMTANAASSTAISAIAQSAGTVTVTAAGHGLTSGDLVSIDSVADYTYCGLVTVNVTNANVFTYSRVTTNSSSSGGYVTKLQGTWASYSGGTGPSYKGGPLLINASSQLPALRVTQGGNGYALIVEDAANPDTSAFIIANDGSLSINTNKFTVDAATGNTVIAGTLTLAGGINLNGNVTIGDASSDTLTVNSTITSNLIFTDNTYDIGASGATRPRTLYLGTSLITPAVTNSGLTSGRIPYSTTGGLQTDSANLLYSGTDLTVYGVRVGRGAGAVSTNTAVGNGALNANVSGIGNSFFGYIAGYNTTGNYNSGFGYGAGMGSAGAATGDANTALGFNALPAYTTGYNNVAVGNNALFLNTTGFANMAMGQQALANNTTGSYNIGIGVQALYNNTASYNTAIGYTALYANTTATYNTALGYQAGYNVTTGGSNTAVGTQALFSNTGQTNNTAVGFEAGYSNVNNGGVTAVGYRAGKLNTTGSVDAFGYEALTANTTGGANAAFGLRALYANTTGGYNTAIGNTALYSNTTASNNTAVGYQAGYSNTTGGVTAVGRHAAYSNSVGYIIAIGDQAGYTYNSSGENYGTVAIGNTSAFNTSSGHDNVTLGAYAFRQNTTGNYNVAVGAASLYSNTTASNNAAIGYQALYSNTTGSQNIAMGHQAGYNTTTGNYSTFLGYQAGLSNTSANFNTAVGYRSLFNSNRTADTNASNTAMGVYAGYGISTGVYNALFGGDGSVGGAGYSLGAGSNNSFFGARSGYQVTTGSANTIIGNYSGNQGGLDIRTASNYIVLSDGDGTPQFVINGSNQSGLFGLPFSGWDSTRYRSLQFGNGTSARYFSIAQQYTAACAGSLLWNAYGDGDNAFKYAVTGDRAAMIQISSDAVNIYGAPTGTAGNAISWSTLLGVQRNFSVALQGASGQSGTGITFPSTQNASSNANTLDDYEEGTWTPGIDLTSGSATYSNRTGSYTKIGNVCYVWGMVTFTATAGVTILNISGLPFNTAGYSGWYPGPAMTNWYYIDLGTASATVLGGYWMNGNNYIRLHTCGNNTNQYSPQTTSSTMEIRFEGFYTV